MAVQSIIIQITGKGCPGRGWKRPEKGRKVEVMHILTLILMFILCSIGAAFKGDFSGLAAIAQFVIGAGCIIFLLWLLVAHPLVLVLVYAVVIGIFVHLKSK